MTGGGTGACLQTTESRGLGEGWSDAFAEWLEHTDAFVPDFTMARSLFLIGIYLSRVIDQFYRWVYDSPNGYRSHPYSTDPAVNPLKYGDLVNRTEVHEIGEVCLDVLFKMY
ncbi:hypothetical protein FRC19_007460 [Serendipita sp. 401]|nr:hypothetical protein FRC19_007460 [Serendipita sp. 401]